MSFADAVALTVAIALLVYLVVALFRADRTS